MLKPTASPAQSSGETPSPSSGVSAGEIDATNAMNARLFKSFVLKSDLINDINQVTEPKLSELEARLKTICDERIQAFAKTLYASMRVGYAEVGENVDRIRKAMSGKCDNDLTDDITNVSMLKTEAPVIDMLRTKKPGTFKKLVQAAQLLVDGDALKRSAQAMTLADGLMGKASGDQTS
jgi:hypothetical protein